MARIAKKTKTAFSDAAITKLASSGLSPEVAQELGIIEGNAYDWDASLHPVNALRFAYRDLDGADSGFFRVRYLGDLPGFAGVAAKPQRYAQPPDTLNWVYLPSLKGLDWSTVANDATMPLLVTEGELKAACACDRGFLTVALGGVSVWQSSRKRVALLPPLDRFAWKGRSVMIVFDSDAASNPQVAQASVRLAKELLRLGAVPQVATLPPAINGDKQGLDDFLVAGQDLGAVLSEARGLGLAERLVSLNERYAYVTSQNVVVDLITLQRIKRDDFINGLLANAKEIEYQPTAKGTKRVELSVPREWLGWASRRDVRLMVYEPGRPRITSEGNLNTWESWGCEPRPGNVQPWLDLLDYVFHDEPEHREWFCQWLAYPLQHHGVKLYTGCLMWGPETGTGKSLIGVVMGRVYGTNFTIVENSDLFSPFNEWAIGKQFVLGDEISGTDKRSESDKLKGLITRPMVRINAKHLPTYEIRDLLNYYLTSNHCDGLFLEDRDRRWFIHRMPQPQPPREFYRRFMRWLDEEGGKEALFDWLLCLELGSFDPQGPAPVSQAKLEMIDHSRSDVAAFVQDLKRNLEEYRGRLKRLLHLPEEPAVVLNRHLQVLYDPDGATRITANGMGRALSAIGMRSVLVQRTASFGSQRFYLLADVEKWQRASSQELREYVDRLFPRSSTTRKF